MRTIQNQPFCQVFYNDIKYLVHSREKKTNGKSHHRTEIWKKWLPTSPLWGHQNTSTEVG